MSAFGGDPAYNVRGHLTICADFLFMADEPRQFC